ncbi:MAG: 4Fe-4S dicluster domain-containing protein [Firmicutes bacterium]|nr:4Fe-4S dicluster domain-containing protein [Bacillota bacterium]
MERYQVIDEIKQKVLTEVSRMALNNELESEIDGLPYRIIDRERPTYRCCVYHERAVVAERARLAMGLDGGKGGGPERLSSLVGKAAAQKRLKEPVTVVIDAACDACPIDRYNVTNACRNCMAHACRNVCPREAIVIAGGRALIDQSRCIECGRCAGACPFNAIVEVIRPCIRACSIGAIQADQERKAHIDYRQCVSCGNCIQACPYGAIADKSALLPVVAMLRGRQPVYAVLAPSFVGQFGSRVSPAKLREGLMRLGFADVLEAAEGAELVAREEAEEYLLEKHAEGGLFLSTCCPGFDQLVKKRYPELARHQFKSASPMVRTGQLIKERHPRSRVVFIGPCVAKKAEALQPAARRFIDAVLTFDELKALFKAADIDPTALKGRDGFGKASRSGRIFARAGGVSEALTDTLTRLEPGLEVSTERADGLAECDRMLRAAAAGRLPGGLVEGMACAGGCVGGPATSLKPAVAARMVDEFSREGSKSAG